MALPAGCIQPWLVARAMLLAGGEPVGRMVMIGVGNAIIVWERLGNEDIVCVAHLGHLQ